MLANLVNNLPATLALVPIVAAHPAWVLAVLLGVNIGPERDLRRVAGHVAVAAAAAGRRQAAGAASSTLLGLLTVPVLLVGATSRCGLGLSVIVGTARCEVSLTSRTEQLPSAK